MIIDIDDSERGSFGNQENVGTGLRFKPIEGTRLSLVDVEPRLGVGVELVC